MGKHVQTVNGPIPADALGITITHEHFFWDQSPIVSVSPDMTEKDKELMHAPVSMELLGWLHFHVHKNYDNLKQDNIELAIEEAKLYKNAGGTTVVDATPDKGLARRPESYREISEATGLNIIMGCGYYGWQSHPPELKNQSVEQIADGIIDEIENGVGTTGIKPGIIGEIALQTIDNEQELKVLRAASRAQKQTGLPLYIHPPFVETKGNEVLDVVEQEGADMQKVVYCHSDFTGDNPAYQNSLAARGVYLEFDQFGLEFPIYNNTIFLPRDIERIKAIKAHIDNGNLQHILLSQDVCFKSSLVTFGGWGYAHILNNLVHHMLREGITREQIDVMMIENPKRMLAM